MGLISTFTLKKPLWPTFELVHVHRVGDSHSHALKELALCALGEGWVSIAGTKKPIGPGDLVEIPANSNHYFAPKAGDVLVMVIFHERGQKQ